MSLKQSIIIKNEFTHNGVDTPGKGSRGGSPGRYVLQYMARLNATETLTPVATPEWGSVFDYTMRYMLRESATESLKRAGLANTSIEGLKQEFREQDRLTGRSFGRSGISLSDDAVRESSERIQQAFDNGHAVQKIILSFTEDYLKETGVVGPTFKHKGNGSYRGHIDQLKLRFAITNGVEKLIQAGGYHDPEWVGVIQVDTSHVHAHIALVDTEFSPRRLVTGSYKNQVQDRGKISAREKAVLRRGIHYGLQDMKTLKSYHQHVSLERQNVVGFVKDYAFSQASHNSQLQLVVAALPENKRYWRYGTNRHDMKRANELSEQYVRQLFNEQPVRSGYQDARRAIDEYAADRAKTEGLSKELQDKLIKNGEKLLIERSVNGVYSVLKSFDKRALPIQTVMMDIQSSSEQELLQSVSDGFDQAGFELRVRGYQKRRDHHQYEAGVYKSLADSFDEAYEDPLQEVSEQAFVLRRFYEEELQWHMALTDKYRYFFGLNEKHDRECVSERLPEYQSLRREYERLLKYDTYLYDVDSGTALSGLSDRFDITDRDEIFKHADDVNTYVEDLYGVKSGVRAFSDLYRPGFEQNVDQDKQRYMKHLRRYTFDCFMDGVATQADWRRIQAPHRDMSDRDYQETYQDSRMMFRSPVEPKPRSEGITLSHFNSVKALDIHHLGVDYYGKQDRSIAERFRETFAEAMRWREYFVEQAKTFLIQTKQSIESRVMSMVTKDVKDMRETVDKMTSEGLIPTVDPIQTSYGIRNTRTIRLDTPVDVTPVVQQESVGLIDDLPDALSQLEGMIIEPDRDIDDDRDGPG